MTQNAEGCRHDGVTSAPQPVASVANGFSTLPCVGARNDRRAGEKARSYKTVAVESLARYSRVCRLSALSRSSSSSKL